MVKRDRARVALNIENDRLTAVEADAGDSRVQIRRWLSADRPSTVDAADPAALGRWVGEELRKSELWRAAKAAGVVFAVPRGEVVIKRISLPPGSSAVDVPGMVRLQMIRQLTVSPENAAIDFVPITPGVGEPSKKKDAVPVPPGGGAASVLAGALQGDRLEWRASVARAAGLRLARVGLRSAGAAALLAEAAQRRGGSTLGIALGSGSTEFVVVEDGQLVFARATDLYLPDRSDDIESFAAKVAVEAKRTWMSYRVAPETTEIEAVVVLGADDAARQVAAQCRDGLALPSEAADYPPFVEAPSGMSPTERTVMAPLVGLLAEPAIGRAILDFANPRRAPDLAAARRQRVLLAALLAIVSGGGLLTMARLDLHRREVALAAAQREYDRMAGDYAEYLRTRARVEHLEQWTAARVDWMAHLDELAGKLPDPREGILDRLDGRGEMEVAFRLPGNQRQFLKGEWQSSTEAVFEVVGSVKQRGVADALRKLLVEDSEYTVESKGADTPDRFDLLLRAATAKPKGPAAKPAAPQAAAPPSFRKGGGA